jgi:cell division protease FtsH
MVTQYGMTERLGAIKLGEANAEPFLGRDLGHSRNYSEDVAAVVDEETKKLLTNAHQEAFDILEENRDVLDTLVIALLERETLDKAEVAEVFSALRRRPERPAWTGSPTREPSPIPPVRVPQAAQNGTNGVKPEEPKGTTIITPPGSGGDIHGTGPLTPGPAGPGSVGTQSDPDAS